ncbi:MAG: hypothetical protein WBA34_09240 [Candidatus Deferrimicrobiaceae bacterium]
MIGLRVVMLPILLTLLGVTACGGDSIRPAAQIEGMWGGEHITLAADESGGALEYDCAHGMIDEPLIPIADGDFDFVGTHTLETGGPVHVDDPPDIHPAQYQGHVSGSTLTLTVTLTDSGDVLGPYTLVRSDPGRLHKCL